MAEKRLRERIYRKPLPQTKDHIFPQMFTSFSKPFNSEESGQQQFYGKSLVECIIIISVLSSSI